jgi:hypothetical protein
MISRESTGITEPHHVTTTNVRFLVKLPSLEEFDEVVEDPIRTHGPAKTDISFSRDPTVLKTLRSITSLV